MVGLFVCLFEIESVLVEFSSGSWVELSLGWDKDKESIHKKFESKHIPLGTCPAKNREIPTNFGELHRTDLLILIQNDSNVLHNSATMPQTKFSCCHFELRTMQTVVNLLDINKNCRTKNAYLQSSIMMQSRTGF